MRAYATVAAVSLCAGCVQARAQSIERDVLVSDVTRSDAPMSEPAVAAREPDGNDEPEEAGSGALPPTLTARSVGRAPGGLHRICDLTPFRDALFVAAANQPLGSDGAVIARYQPIAGRSSWTVAFDWNRPGQPRRGGGGGQGFLRVRAIGDRLYVPDADTPYKRLWPQ